MNEDHIRDRTSEATVAIVPSLTRIILQVTYMIVLVVLLWRSWIPKGVLVQSSKDLQLLFLSKDLKVITLYCKIRGDGQGHVQDRARRASISIMDSQKVRLYSILKSSCSC